MDTSSCILPDNTVYTGYLRPNSSSEKSLVHCQPLEQESELVLSKDPVVIQSGVILAPFPKGKKALNFSGFNNVAYLHAKRQQGF